MSAWSTPYFTKLLGWLSPTSAELLALGRHRSSIKSRLEKAFSLSKLEVIGSHSRNTANRGASDLDLLAVVARDDVRWGGGTVSSNTLLRRFKEELADRFWDTGIGRDGQAVVLEFDGGSTHIDVVPAVFKGWSVECRSPIYLIPDGTGNWLETSPEAHNNYILAADRASGGKLLGVVRLIKHWRECRSPRIPLLSFHLELLLAFEKICAVGNSYGECLRRAFSLLASRQGRGLHDPLGVSGTVAAASTLSQQFKLAEASQYADLHASSALVAEIRDNDEEAYRQWDLVFNGRLPAQP